MNKNTFWSASYKKIQCSFLLLWCTDQQWWDKKKAEIKLLASLKGNTILHMAFLSCPVFFTLRMNGNVKCVSIWPSHRRPTGMILIQADILNERPASTEIQNKFIFEFGWSFFFRAGIVWLFEATLLQAHQLPCIHHCSLEGLAFAATLWDSAQQRSSVLEGYTECTRDLNHFPIYDLSAL